MNGSIWQRAAADGWRDYCVYSGRHLPDEALSKEHVIPMSLGGGRSTVIRASAVLNNRFAREIDARIAADPMVQFGRRDADARGHSRRSPVPRWTRAQPWRNSDPMPTGHGRLNVDFPKTGGPVVYDTSKGRPVGRDVWNGQVLLTRLEIDVEARLKFCLKTLLGVGWRVFGPALLDAVPVEDVRSVLGVEGVNPTAGLRMSYLDPLAVQEPAARRYVSALKGALVASGKTTLLLRQADGEIEWSVACVGHYLGSLVLPAYADLSDAPKTGGLLFTADRGGLRRELRQELAIPSAE